MLISELTKEGFQTDACKLAKLSTNQLPTQPITARLDKKTFITKLNLDKFSVLSGTSEMATKRNFKNAEDFTFRKWKRFLYKSFTSRLPQLFILSIFNIPTYRIYQREWLRNRRLAINWRKFDSVCQS